MEMRSCNSSIGTRLNRISVKFQRSSALRRAILFPKEPLSACLIRRELQGTCRAEGPSEHSGNSGCG